MFLQEVVKTSDLAAAGQWGRRRRPYQGRPTTHSSLSLCRSLYLRRVFGDWRGGGGGGGILSDQILFE